MEANLNVVSLMLVYRCYLLDEFDRIKAFVELSALGDAEAIALAQRDPRLGRGVFEVWRGREMIHRNQQVNPVTLGPLPEAEV